MFVQARDRYCEVKFVFVLKIIIEGKIVFVLKITLPRIHLVSLCPGRRFVPESTRLYNISANMEYNYLRREHSGGTVRTETRMK